MDPCGPIRLVMTANTGSGGENNRTVMVHRLMDQESGVVLGMALSAGSPMAIIDGGIAVGANGHDAGSWRVAGKAGIGPSLMDTARPV